MTIDIIKKSIVLIYNITLFIYIMSLKFHKTSVALLFYWVGAYKYVIANLYLYFLFSLYQVSPSISSKGFWFI